MYQQEIKFFWPLTEQIPLDLDYTGCDSRSLFTTTTGPSNSVLTVTAGTGASWVTSEIRLQEKQTTMVVLKKPNIFRKFLFKMLGLKWEVR